MDTRPDDYEPDSQPTYREKIERPAPRPLIERADQLAERSPGAKAAAERFIKAQQCATEEGRQRYIAQSIEAGRIYLHVPGIYGMKGTFEPVFPECPHCNMVHRRQVRNDFLEKLHEVFTGTPAIIWAATLPCDDCLKGYEAKTESAKAERARRDLEACGFGKAMLTWSFGTYPIQNSEWLKRAHDYVAAGAPHDLIIWGNPGVGKTGLGVGILKELYGRRHSVRFIRATEIMLLLRDSMSPKGMSAGMSEMEILQALGSVDYLLVDDLSAINGTAYQDEVMSFLIDLRQRENRPTILTLNCKVPRGADPSNALMQFFGDRVFDRLREYGEEWRITGHSLRRGR